jgi:hypothetical protein
MVFRSQPRRQTLVNWLLSSSEPSSSRPPSHMPWMDNMGPIRTAQLAEPNPSLHKPCRRRYPALLPRLRTGRPNRPVTT